MKKNLKRLLEPSSIAVIGASRDEDKPGGRIIKNLLDGGYDGKLYPINPGVAEIKGLQVFPDIREAPKEIDLVILVLRRDYVVEAYRACVEAEVGSVLIISAGFSDAGPEGLAVQKQIDALAAESGILTIGPNSVGLVNGLANTFASFVPFAEWTTGGVSLVGQSGIYAGAVTHELMGLPTQRIGINTTVDIGNKTNVHENDLLEYFIADESTSVIGMYIESFVDITEFVRIAREAPGNKPIIVLRSGITRDGARAAYAHTGAVLSGNDEDAQALSRAGVILAQDEADFISLVRTMEYSQASGPRVGVISYSGALGILATDAIAQAGLQMPSFELETLETLKEVCPDWQVVGNPADLWAAAEAGPESVARTTFLKVINDTTVDQVLLVLLALPNVDFAGMRSVFEEMRAAQPTKPIHVVSNGALSDKWALEMDGLNIVRHSSTSIAARAMAVLSQS